MKIVNLTPHDINIITEGGIITFPASGSIARVATMRETVREINGVPVNRTVFGEVVGLPAPEDDTMYIVSLATAKAAPERDDLLITDEAVRDDSGRVIGCKAFATV